MGPWTCYLRATWRVFCDPTRARPLWSLSVEDLKQWRRLCLAMLAGRTPAWFLKYAVFSELARLQEVNDVLAAGVGHEMLLDDREPALT